MAEEDDEPDLHPKRRENAEAVCPRHSKKDYRVLVEAAWTAGWWCETRGSNYIACYPPDGGDFVMVPSTPSGTRTLRNIRARLRRAGVPV